MHRLCRKDLDTDTHRHAFTTPNTPSTNSIICARSATASTHTRGAPSVSIRGPSDDVHAPAALAWSHTHNKHHSACVYMNAVPAIHTWGAPPEAAGRPADEAGATRWMRRACTHAPQNDKFLMVTFVHAEIEFELDTRHCMCWPPVRSNALGSRLSSIHHPLYLLSLSQFRTQRPSPPAPRRRQAQTGADAHRDRRAKTYVFRNVCVYVCVCIHVQVKTTNMFQYIQGCSAL